MQHSRTLLRNEYLRKYSLFTDAIIWLKKRVFSFINERFILLTLSGLFYAPQSSAQIEINIGTASAGNSANSYLSPLQDRYEGSRAQYLNTASELNAAGIEPGSIVKLEFSAPAQNTDLPVFISPTPEQDTILYAIPGMPFSFIVKVMDPDENATLQINFVKYPTGSIITAMPPSGNSFESRLSWTPLLSDYGNYLVVLAVQDNFGNIINRSFNIIVDCGCIRCNVNTTVVDENVVVDFNTDIPTYSGDPDLLPYFTWDKSGSTPDTWKAIFNLGRNKLLIKNTVTLTTKQVNGYAPGIVIKDSCDIILEKGSQVTVIAKNKNAGDVYIEANGNLDINGEIKQEVKPGQGLPGAVTVKTTCGNLIIGPSGIVQILGNNQGGNTINIISCDAECRSLNAPLTNNGNTSGERIGHPAGGKNTPNIIWIDGLVKSYAKSHNNNPANFPNINIAGFNNTSVFIHGNTKAPLYDEFELEGSKYDLWGGLLSWIGDNVTPGKIQIQSNLEIEILGHTVNLTPTVRKSFGAVAAISTGTDAPGGSVDIRSFKVPCSEPYCFHSGAIFCSGRAVDVSGRNLLKSGNFAHIRLWALNLVNLFDCDDYLGDPPGTNCLNNLFPIIDASSPYPGDKGGKIEIRGFSNSVFYTNTIFGDGIPFTNGNILVEDHSIVSAAVPVAPKSVQGIIDLTTCLGVRTRGTVTFSPDYTSHIDCNSTNSVPPLFTDCENLDEIDRNEESFTKGTKISTIDNLNAFPNPFSHFTTIAYELKKDADVSISIYNAYGRAITTLMKGKQLPGKHQFTWNAKDQGPGFYYVYLKMGNEVKLHKLIVLK
jgi:hypothetical protein